MLRELPELFGSLQRLVTFDATSSGLSKLPKTFSHLINLEEIILENCISLHELPTTMKHFAKLKTFNAQDTICHYLPRDFEHLHNLNVLKLHNIEEGSILMPQDSVLYLCDALEVLELRNCRGHPLNIHEFKRLRTLTLHNSRLEGFLVDDQHHGCSVPITPNYDNNYASPSNILNEIIEIPNLEYLKLRNCDYINKLSSTILPGLLNLISLTIHECPLEALPNDFGRLHNLQYLNIDLGANHHKPTICKLPDSFSGLSNLRNLTLRNFKDLQDMPSSMMGLQRLWFLTLHACPLRAFPDDFGRLHSLKELNIDLGANHHKPTISKLPDSFSELSNLTKLKLRNFKYLHDMPSSMMGLQRLRILSLYACPLQALPDDFGRFHKLEQLNIDLGANHHKPTISKLPDSFSGLSNLTNLTLKNFKDLHELPLSITGLVMLHHFKMCSSTIQSLPSYVKDFTNLTELRLEKINSLQKLPDSLSSLKRLRNLDSILNRDLVELPNGFGELQALTKLNLHGCSIKDIARRDLNIGQLTSLTWLNLKYNRIVISPKILEDLGTLQYLNMSHCRNLTTIEGLPKTLEVLDLGACRKLAFIPSIAILKKLTFLSRCNCEALEHLYDLESLEALKELNLSGCSTLQCSSILSSNVVLERCYLSGSSVFILYDNDWKKVSISFITLLSIVINLNLNP
jgi:Leucine-rich repeat (LRR) protein